MPGTLKTRRTHYEILELEPTATGDEIEQAFAGAISIFRPHGFAGVAEATVAFRTLSDPARRREYDKSLGLTPKPEPRPSPMTWRVGAQFLTASGMTVMPQALGRPVMDRLALAEPQPRPPVVTEPSPEPEAAPFIAAALRELANPEPLIERARTAPVAIGPRDSADRRAYLTLAEGPGDAPIGPTPWKRVGIVAGGAAAAVALLGAWAGWDSAGSAEPAETVAKATLPPPTTFTLNDPSPAATPNRVLDVAPSPPPPRRTARAATRSVRDRPTSRLAGLEQQLAKPPEPDPAQADPTAEVADVAPVTAAASLPLPNRVIAHTLDRIGYPCGQVASATQSAAAGVFKVTCTSGHSYQASPVRGRYHFRRLAGG